MLNPQFVAGEHGLFGGHKSEDIRTFLILLSFISKTIPLEVVIQVFNLKLFKHLLFVLIRR